jgi:hypothetical protein
MKEKPLHLSALNLDLSIPECVYFYDDGFVEDIGAHLEFLDYYYGRKGIPHSKLDSKTVGLTSLYASKNQDLFKFHIFYLDGSGIYTRAHEETHFLHAVKRLPALSEAIKIRRGFDLNFEEVKDSIEETYARRETIAEIGAIFAVHQEAGIEGLSLYNRGLMPCCIHFHEAYSIYLRAMRREK